MIYVGIDVAKDKHDCFILNHEGEVKADVFTIANNAEGFEQLRQTIQACLVSERASHSGVAVIPNQVSLATEEVRGFDTPTDPPAPRSVSASRPPATTARTS